jgi:hypothetical protein
MDEGSKREYDRLRKRLKYDENICCWRCSIPGDWCPYYSSGVACKSEDNVMPICWTAWSVVELRNIIKGVAGRGFRDGNDYMEWLSKGCRVRDVKGTNALAVFDAIICYLEDQRKQQC